MKRKTTPLKKSALPPSITKSEIDAAYAELFRQDDALLPGEMTLAQFAKKYSRGANRMRKELDALVAAGKMAKRDDVFIRGQPFTTYYLVQQNDNSNLAIKLNKPKR